MLKKILYAGFAISLVCASAIFVWVASLEIPSLDGFGDRTVIQSTKIYDRTGRVLLFDLHENIRRTVVPLEEISRYAKNAAVAIEDAEFYEHSGIKPKSILRAVLVNIQSGSYSQGGSTITQQIVKNALLTKQKTIARKVKEWILAIKLEAKMSKDQILEIYLNDSPYGGTIYGIEEASQYFFGISATDLSITQSAYLAALPQRPTYYSPYGEHKEGLEARKNLVLAKMYEKGFITKVEYEDSMNERVDFIEYGDKNIKAPHFVFYVRDYLEEKYGRAAVYESGLKVISTLDYSLQKESEKLVKQYAEQNKEKFNAENAAMVAIDPQTGQILAMVGSRDYFDEDIDGKFNIATALRQPGSTFKPIVYSLAFEKGYTPNTVLFDLPTQFSVNCNVDTLEIKDECYAPRNYDNRFRGPMTMANALAQSINIPAVKTLYLVGITNAIEHAANMGITSLTKAATHYGFSLVLGGGEVSLLELTGAYGSFANDGILNKNSAILSVEDNTGEVLEEYEQDAERVLSANSARKIAHILSDNTARAPVYGANSPLFFSDKQVAAKTGTTNSFRDAWIVGFTPNIVIGTWAGNNNNTPMLNEFAGFILAPLWHDIMADALTRVPNIDFQLPTTEISDATSSIQVSTSSKPVLSGEWQSPSVHSILHWVDKDDPTGSIPENPNIDQQYKFWEYPVSLWSEGNGISSFDLETTEEQPQTASTGTSSNASANRYMHLSYPKDNSQIQNGTLLTTQLDYSQTTSLTNVEYYLDGVFVGMVNVAPFSISIIVPQYIGKHTIKAIGRSGFTGSYVSEISFLVN